MTGRGAGNRRFLPVMVHPEQAEVHILEDESSSRAYMEQLWAEAMTIYRKGRIRLAMSKAMQTQLRDVQAQFMPEDTKTGLIQSYLEVYTGKQVCSKQLYKEALNHTFDEPKQWEIREINDIMNNCVEGWTSFTSPRTFPGYGRQRGWEKCSMPAATDMHDSEFFTEIPDEEAEQMELPF